MTNPASERVREARRLLEEASENIGKAWDLLARERGKGLLLDFSVMESLDNTRGVLAHADERIGSAEYSPWSSYERAQEALQTAIGHVQMCERVLRDAREKGLVMDKDLLVSVYGAEGTLAGILLNMKECEEDCEAEDDGCRVQRHARQSGVRGAEGREMRGHGRGHRRHPCRGG